ncbi:MAG: glutamyl-tRNA reductase [Candidatus Latescibacterota bacterium]
MNRDIPIGLIGISHKTAPVEIREKVALSEAEQIIAYREFVDHFGIDGCLILSTCNRTEVYLSGRSVLEALPRVRSWLDDHKKAPYFSDVGMTYEKVGVDAVRHFFCLSASLDSQVIGEGQITGQIKDSYTRALEAKATDTMLNKLFNYGIQAGKKVRNDTFLSDGAVSVSYAGVKLARKIFDDLKDKEVLLIGTGETAELAALHFQEEGVQKLHIANRTLDKATQMADRFSGKAHGLSEIQTVLEQVDIVISATASTDYLITEAMMEAVCKAKHHQPIFLIDLAIPRDIDPEIDSIDGVYLYNLNDLQDIVQMNFQKREQEIPKALKIVEEHVGEFQKWASTHSMVSVIQRLKNHFEEVRNRELKRLRNRLPGDDHPEIDYLTQSITNKLLHQHIKSLKKTVSDPEKYQQHVDFISGLYELDMDR